MLFLVYSEVLLFKDLSTNMYKLKFLESREGFAFVCIRAMVPTNGSPGAEFPANRDSANMILKFVLPVNFYNAKYLNVEFFFI